MGNRGLEKKSLSLIDEYIERTVKIRKLSVPSISEASDETRYRRLFIRNYSKIIPLYEKNKEIIDEVLNPLFVSDSILTPEEVLFLETFSQSLQNNNGVEYLDASLLWKISDRLFQDALKKDDIDYLISQLDLRIIAATGKVIQIKSLNDSEDIWSEYQKKGQEAAEMIFEYLKKDKFASIASEDSRELLVINSRYFCVLFEAPNQSPEINEMIINRLIDSYNMSFDTDYTELLSDYDWIRHRVKCLEYLGQLTERNNEQGITDAQAERILEYVLKLKDFYDEDPVMMEQYISQADIDLFLTKNKYYSGRISNEEYKNKLIYYYKNRYSDRLGARFKEYSTFINFQLPNEYIGALDQNLLSEEDISNVEYIYQGVIMDAFSMPNKDEFIAAMEYFTRLLDHYIEIPGGISFKDFCTKFMAATMPRIYIHTVSVAELSRCITGYLLSRRPELFLGVQGAQNIDEVKAKRINIMAYAYNAGIVHDIGKVGLLPIATVAERPVFPEEEILMDRHTVSGRKLAKKAVSTSPYANIISGSKLYNSKEIERDGYSSWKVPEKVIVDILRLASGIDKIAEQLERQGKNVAIKNFYPTLKKESGNRYAPYLLNILSMRKVQNDLDFILNGGRDDIYRRAFIMLKGVLDRGMI